MSDDISKAVAAASRIVYDRLTHDGFPGWLSAVGAAADRVIVYTAKRDVPPSVTESLAQGVGGIRVPVEFRYVGRIRASAIDQWAEENDP